MKDGQSLTIDNMPIGWLALGCFAICAVILVGVILIARPYLQSKNGNVASAIDAITVQAKTTSPSPSAQPSSSDATALFPLQP